MNGQSLLSERQIAASLLVLGFVVFAIGGILFSGRAFLKWPIAQTVIYLRWERSLIMVALIVNALGLVALEDLLHAGGDPLLARLGAVTYLIGAVVALVAEARFLSTREWVYTQIVIYVVLAFLAQVAFGLSVLQTGLLAGWIGWATILWNVGWLIGLCTTRPPDIYFPVLHHVAPLLIGIALLI